VLGLPFLEALPRPARAGGTGAPLRLVILVHPQGTILDAWTPASTGTDFVMPEVLAPLEAIRTRINIVSPSHQPIEWP
jgi:hypothetical protein